LTHLKYITKFEFLFSNHGSLKRKKITPVFQRVFYSSIECHTHKGCKERKGFLLKITSAEELITSAVSFAPAFS